MSILEIALLVSLCGVLSVVAFFVGVSVGMAAGSKEWHKLMSEQLRTQDSKPSAL